MSVDPAYACQAALALGPKGEALVTSNILPTVWKIDPETLAVSEYALVLDADQDKDMCDTIQAGAAQVNAQTVKGIALMAAKRASVVAQLATSGEQGLAGVEASVWNAFFLPKGTPAPIVRRLNGAIGDMVSPPLG